SDGRDAGSDQAECPAVRSAVEHWKAYGLDLEPMLYVPDLPANAARRQTAKQDHGLDKALDNKLIAAAAPALSDGYPVKIDIPVRNEHRSVGAMLGGEVTRRFGGAGLPDDTIDVTLRGTAGQSFGAFVPSGVTLRLYGDADDYIGKGLSGGRLIVRPDTTAPFAAEAAQLVLGGAEAAQLVLGGAEAAQLVLGGAEAAQLVLGGAEAAQLVLGG